MPADPPPISTPARLHWLDGVLGFTQGDRRAIERARQGLRQRPLPAASAELRERARAVTSFNDRSLAALGLALEGDEARAGRELAALEWECVGLSTCPMNNYDAAFHHLAGARWLLAAGDTAQAVRLLRWHESFQGGIEWTGTLIFTPFAHLELARIHEARGAVSEARENYQRFLRSHDAPMPSERHVVEAARQRIARLSGPPGSS
jgi:hypothetical protein